MKKQIPLKQIRLSYNIAEGDLKTRVRQATGHIIDGYRVRLELRLKGRQNAHPDIGLERVKDAVLRIFAEVGPLLHIERPASVNVDGRIVTAQLKLKTTQVG